MKIDIYEKIIPTKFISINGVEFVYDRLLGCLEELMRTEPDDDYGDYSLRSYELSFKKETEILVKMGLIKNYIGPRKANLYCIKNEESLKIMEKLQKYLYDWYSEKCPCSFDYIQLEECEKE